MIIVTPGLPKTRSGKIMRRILRKIVCKESDSLGDISTLADPSVVASLIEKVDSVWAAEAAAKTAPALAGAPAAAAAASRDARRLSASQL